MVVKMGKNGGTYAHRDMSFEFGSAISASFKLYLITEFQRLKADENDRLKLDWNLQRTLAKVNYHIHTDAIRENLIPKELSKGHIATIEQLVVLSNLESINAVLIIQELKQSDRLKQLNQIAITQMRSLVANKQLGWLK